MSIEKKISTIVAEQFPAFMKEEGPNFIAFVRAYYEWMEQANNAIEVSKNLLNYQDIDKTYDKYFEYFHREILGSVPRSTLADKTLLAKNIKEMHQSRGSERSFELLFRLLYDQEISFYYPGEDILRVSDGRWVEETSIRVGIPRVGDTFALNGEIVIGTTSGATARVERISGAIESGQPIQELFLSSIDGNFADGEIVRNTANTITATILNASGPVRTLNVLQGGAFHQSGDVVNILGIIGQGATARVTKTTSDSAIEFVINDGGSGYRVNTTVTNIFGGSGSGAAFTVDAISNTEILTIDNTFIQPVANVVLVTGPTFVSNSQNTASTTANLAVSNVSTALSSALSFSNVTVGSISQITTTGYGFGYEVLPSATARDAEIALQNLDDGSGGVKGENAVIVAQNVTGAIEEADVINFGSNYDKLSEVTLVNQTRLGTVNAIALPEVTGILSYPGKYIDTKGFLSWNNRLQDNYYYQEFSYEIIATQFTNAYRRLVKGLVHPAGTAMFGRYAITSELDTAIQISPDDTQFKLTIDNEITIDVPLIVSASEDGYISNDALITLPYLENQYIANNSILSVVTVVTNTAPSANGTGLLFINEQDTIGDYGSFTIADIGMVPYGQLGTPKLLIGNNTIFQTEIPTTATIRIVDTYGPTPNGIYQTNATYSNTYMSLTTNYASNNLSNGSFVIL